MFMLSSCRHKVWSTVDVIEAAGYPVEVHGTCRTEDGYLMEIVRIVRQGECRFHMRHNDVVLVSSICTLSRIFGPQADPEMVPDLDGSIMKPWPSLKAAFVYQTALIRFCERASTQILRPLRPA